MSDGFPGFTTCKYILACTNIHSNTHMPCLHFTQNGNEDKGDDNLFSENE